MRLARIRTDARRMRAGMTSKIGSKSLRVRGVMHLYPQDVRSSDVDARYQMYYLRTVICGVTSLVSTTMKPSILSSK